MIPKKIHYCWFGENPMPEKDIKNIESWKKFCPDYEIIEWNESNYDVNKISYTKEAYQSKKYAFVSDYARLDIIYREGGIYLDTDVEIIKNIDFLLENKAFCGREKNGNIGLGLIFGSVKSLPIIKDLMDYYNDLHFINGDGSMNLTPIPFYTHSVLVPKGLVLEDCFQEIEELNVYPSSFFDPYDLDTGQPVNKKALLKAYTIHHYNFSWYDDQKKAYFSSCKDLAKKYGVRLYKLGIAAKIEDFCVSKSSVKEEKGTFHALLWSLKNFFVILLKKESKSLYDFGSKK